MNYSGGLKGAAGGAAAGAALGPWGAAAGGVIGGAMGLFSGGGNDEAQRGIQEKLQALADSYKGRTAPQLGPAAQGGYSDYRANQAGLISQLQGMAAGTGPSAAAIQMRDAMDRAIAAQTGSAAGAGGRGVNQGAAYLNAANNGAAIEAQGARDTATMRAQEQLNAVGQLGQNLNAGRQADEQMNQFNAGAQNQMNMANLQAQLQQLGLNDEGQLRALLGSMGANVGPGLGTQILAGGANALPAILQRNLGMQQIAAKQGQQPQQDYSQQAPLYQQPITSPDQV
jgi:hypothetical protein